MKAKFTSILDFVSFFGFTASQDYFTHFEPSQSLRWSKNGRSPRKNTWPPESRTWLVSLWPKKGLNPRWWDDKQFGVLKISVLNHSATGGASILKQMKAKFNFILIFLEKKNYLISEFTLGCSKCTISLRDLIDGVNSIALTIVLYKQTQ